MYYQKITNSDNNRWIVLVHGFCGNSEMWKKQIDTLVKHANLFIIDLPGHGESIKGLIESNIKSFRDLAFNIIKILNQNKIEKATFIGLSLGTLVLAAIAKYFPDSVLNAVFVGPLCGMGLLSKFEMFLGYVFRAIIPHMLTVSIFSKILLPKNGHKTSRKFFIEGAEKISKKIFIEWYEMLYKNINGVLDAKKVIENIKTLFIVGNEDYVFLKGVVEFTKKIRNANLVILKNCGHVCNLQKAQEFNRCIEEFLMNQKLEELQC